MTCTLHVAWDDRLVGYDFGPGHPMAPVRLKLTMELALAFGLGRLDGVTTDARAEGATLTEIDPGPAREELMALVAAADSIARRPPDDLIGP